jgi:hypothetical protein
MNCKSNGMAVATTEEPTRLNILATVLFWSLFAVSCFFILRPSQYGQRTEGLPAELGLWINTHDFISNLAAFFLLGFVGVLSGWGFACVSRQTIKASSLWLAWGGVLLLELMQLQIPGRYFDWKDLLAAGLGFALAWVAWLPLQQKA